MGPSRNANRAECSEQAGDQFHSWAPASLCRPPPSVKTILRGASVMESSLSSAEGKLPPAVPSAWTQHSIWKYWVGVEWEEEEIREGVRRKGVTQTLASTLLPAIILPPCNSAASTTHQPGLMHLHHSVQHTRFSCYILPPPSAEALSRLISNTVFSISLPQNLIYHER